uniref:ATP synthase subunit delta, chloroplastic n=1 Tax=Titanophycus setchellii TaxID=940129 RepID=A0A1G4NY60_9FLOR|nr:ATP synthase CF1 subunit delta [Titanophycus setchellii]SCW23587.1 ATP synthase CF1 subunit delta [Titanophycus setchellii]
MSTKTLVQQVSQPYAEALLEIAKKSNNIDDILQNANVILQILSEVTSLTEFLNNPMISSQSKKDTLKQLFDKQLNDKLLTFVLLLIDRKRIFYLSAILEKYLELAYSLESFVTADVTASMNLTEQQKEKLINKLKQMTGKNNIQLNVSIDSSLIAGFKIQIGSKVIDTSLRGQLVEIGYFLGANNT